MTNNWKHYDSILEIVEALAEYELWISSEDELSEKFDEEVMPEILNVYGGNDQPAIDEAFNNWKDALCKNGDIHPLQCDEYCYTGEYSN